MALIDFEGIDFDTKEGIEQAKRNLTKQARENAVKEIQEENNRGSQDGETEGEQIEKIGNLIADLEEYDKSLARPNVEEITNWDTIPDTPREWLLPNWLPASSVTMFTGQGGLGKSWMTLQIAAHVALGYHVSEGQTPAFLDPNFCNCKEIKTRRVVLATYEDEPAEIKRRLSTLAEEMSWIKNQLDTIRRNVSIVDMRGKGALWGPGIGNHIANIGDMLPAGLQLQEICEKTEKTEKREGAQLLVIDPLSGAFGGNENDRTAVYAFTSAWREWADAAGCAVLMIGHLPKNQEGKDAGFSGSTAWEASARSMITLTTEKYGEARTYWALKHIKSNYARIQNHRPLIKEKRGWWKGARGRKAYEEAAKAYEDYHQHFDTQEDTHDESEAIADLIANS